MIRLPLSLLPGLLTRYAVFQGVYVLTDSRFRWLSRLAGAPPGPELDAVVLRSLHLPCGIVRGALTGLGVPAVVTAEPGAALPACESHSNTSVCPGPRTDGWIGPPLCAGAFTVRIKTPAPAAQTGDAGDRNRTQL